MEEELECPICKKKMKSLVSHVVTAHLMSIENFRKKYPNIKRLQLNCQKYIDCNCDICGKTFKRRNALASHKKNIHSIETKKESVDKKFECPICKKNVDFMKNHVTLGHTIDWEEFCEKYGWDVKNRAFFTEKHKDTLSKNKKCFYDSERGKIQKEIQRKMYSGDANPSKRADVRSKISASAAKRIVDGEIRHTNYGISISFKYNDEKYFVRSFEEFKIVYTFIMNNKKFAYEKKIINYRDEDNVLKKYVVDFIVDEKFIEFKSDINLFDYYNIHKYKEVNKILKSLGNELYIFDYKTMCEEFNLKIPNILDIYEFLKKMIDNDDAKVVYVCGKNRDSRILKKVTNDYKNHKNIRLI